MKNDGYSLIEMIIVVAIIGVVLGIVVVSTGILDGRRVGATTSNVASIIEKVRLTTLGKDEVILRLYKRDGEDVKARIISRIRQADGTMKESMQEEELGGSGVDVYYSNNIDGSNRTPLGYPGIELSFNRSSGALNNSNVQSIILEKGKAVKTIKIYKETGKLLIE